MRVRIDMQLIYSTLFIDKLAKIYQETPLKLPQSRKQTQIQIPIPNCLVPTVVSVVVKIDE